MGLKLTVWKKNDYVRIYLNGPPLEGRAWLVHKRGQIEVQYSQGSEQLARDQVMDHVAEAIGFEPRGWEELLAAAEALPAPRRGSSGSKRASSMRGMSEHYRPPEWTADDTEFLDPNAWKDPLPEETTLVIDDREPREMVDWFRRVENLNVEIASLETGDYLIPDKIVIERKTVADFALSLVEDRKRLFNQTNRIALSGMRGILILEGNIYTQTSLPLNNITGTLSYLVAIQGMTLYQTLSMNHSADMIVKLLRHSVHGLGYDLGLRAAAPKDPSKAAAFVLEGIPGVSAATAKTLMETFGSIVGVAGASVSDLRNVSGIGPKRATKIYDTLHATWESR